MWHIQLNSYKKINEVTGVKRNKERFLHKIYRFTKNKKFWITSAFMPKSPVRTLHKNRINMEKKLQERECFFLNRWQRFLKVMNRNGNLWLLCIKNGNFCSYLGSGASFLVILCLRIYKFIKWRKFWHIKMPINSIKFGLKN